jgi:hypothetical protein
VVYIYLGKKTPLLLIFYVMMDKFDKLDYTILTRGRGVKASMRMLLFVIATAGCKSSRSALVVDVDRTADDDNALIRTRESTGRNY